MYVRRNKSDGYKTSIKQYFEQNILHTTTITMMIYKEEYLQTTGFHGFSLVKGKYHENDEDDYKRLKYEEKIIDCLTID